MLPEKFEKLCSEFMEAESQLLNWKAGEYSDGIDRLQNFREIADFMGNKPVVITPAIVALIYKLKHIQSIKNAVVSGKVSCCWENEGKEGILQRLADDRNYGLLLAACISEESEEDK